MKSAHLITGVLLLNVWAPGAKADAPPPGSLKINSLIQSGCRGDRPSIDVSEDNEAFTLLFDNFSLPLPDPQNRWGDTSSANDDCEIKITFDAVKGWYPQIYQVDVRGFANLTSRYVQLFQQYSFSMTDNLGMSYMGANPLQISTQGPFASEYNRTLTSPIQTGPFVKSNNCYPQKVAAKKRYRLQNTITIKISTHMTRSDRRSTGLLTVDTVDGAIMQMYGLHWGRCD